MRIKARTCAVGLTTSQAENRGMAWVIGSFVLCPCHLPITLAGISLLLSGTAAGALLRGHPIVAGVIITALWLGGTWRGIRYLLSARSDPPAALKLNDRAFTPSERS